MTQMSIELYKQRRDQWQRHAETDQLNLGAFHPATLFDVEMRDTYNAMIASMEAEAPTRGAKGAGMAKRSRVAQAALASHGRDNRVNLYYEDSWGAGYMAIVRYMGSKTVDKKTWNAYIAEPQWLLITKSGWGLPWEETIIEDETAITERMREIQPDMRRWKQHRSWSGGRWW